MIFFLLCLNGRWEVTSRKKGSFGAYGLEVVHHGLEGLVEEASYLSGSGSRDRGMMVLEWLSLSLFSWAHGKASCTFKIVLGLSLSGSSVTGMLRGMSQR